MAIERDLEKMCLSAYLSIYLSKLTRASGQKLGELVLLSDLKASRKLLGLLDCEAPGAPVAIPVKICKIRIFYNFMQNSQHLKLSVS